LSAYLLYCLSFNKQVSLNHLCVLHVPKIWRLTEQVHDTDVIDLIRICCRSRDNCEHACSCYAQRLGGDVYNLFT